MTRHRMLFLIAALLGVFALPASAQAAGHPRRAVAADVRWHRGMAARPHGMHRRWHRREMRWHRREMQWHRREMQWHRRRGMPPV